MALGLAGRILETVHLLRGQMPAAHGAVTAATGEPAKPLRLQHRTRRPGDEGLVPQNGAPDWRIGQTSFPGSSAPPWLWLQARTMASTPARCSTTSAIATSRTRCDIPSCAPTASTDFGRIERPRKLTRGVRFRRRTPGTAHCPPFRRRRARKRRRRGVGT